MKIYIPTFGRVAQQFTWSHLPTLVRKDFDVKLLVDITEADMFARTDYPVQVLPKDIFGIGKVRQWVLDQSSEPFLLIDDDLRFATRSQDDPTKFHGAYPDEIYEAFREISQILSPEIPHVGMASREGGNRNTEYHTHNTRILRVLGYDAITLKTYGIRFDRVPVMEDFDVALQLLRAGLPNRCINWIVHDQKGSNTKGGCSTYRSMAVQAEAAHKLKELHPDFVSVVQKTTSTAWGGQTRTDVTIQWKKAYASAFV